MTDFNEGVELDELQPLAEQADPTPAATAPRASVPPVFAGTGCVSPAFNPAAQKEYYRFFFAGMVMLLGCLMPFGPDYAGVGYKTLGGAFYTLIAVGMLWSWWGAIATNKFSSNELKWVALATIPFVLQLLGLVKAFEAPAVAEWIARHEAGQAGPIAKNWGELFGALPAVFTGSDADSAMTVSNFFRAYGSGRVVLFFGALLAEVFLVMALVGGVSEVNAQKKAKVAEARARRGGGDGDGDAEGKKKGRGRRR